MEITVRRTTLKRGAEEAYERLHARLPDAVADALLAAGVESWQIWRDGSRLLHIIVTRAGLPSVLAQMRSRGPIDPDWDAAVAELLDDAPDAEAELAPVWLLEAAGQKAGQKIASRA